jgi:hypothetical protein
MKIVHYSKDEYFEPEAIETVDGYIGCWFYECPEFQNDVDEMCNKWGGRTAHFFEIEDEYIELEQDFGSIKEYFVEGKNLGGLKRVNPELSYEY